MESKNYVCFSIIKGKKEDGSVRKSIWRPVIALVLAVQMTLGSTVITFAQVAESTVTDITVSAAQPEEKELITVDVPEQIAPEAPGAETSIPEQIIPEIPEAEASIPEQIVPETPTAEVAGPEALPLGETLAQDQFQQEKPLEEADDTGYIYLTDLKYQDLVCGWQNDYRFNGQAVSGPLQLLDSGEVKTYTKGICNHAPGYVTYDISGLDATRFTALIGVNYIAGDKKPEEAGSCDFTVEIDGKEVFKSGTIYRKNNHGVIDIEIPAGAKSLKLIGGDAGDRNTCDHAVWVEPRLYMPVTDLTSLKYIEISGAPRIPQGEISQLIAKGVAINGTDISLDGSSPRFSSSDPAVATVSDTGLATAVSVGTAAITCQATVDGITKEGTFAIEVVPDTNVKGVVQSPSKRSEIKVSLIDGKIFYSATQDGKRIVELSPIGMKTTLGDFSNGLTYKDSGEIKEINETYDTISGKKSKYINHANEVTYTFTNTKADMEFDVIVRAYDDGIAFRNAIRKADGSSAEIEISEETSSFVIPAGSDVTAMPNRMGDTTSHEDYFDQKKIENLNGDQTLPLLYQAPNGAWTLLTEAVLDGTYSGSVVKREAGTELGLKFPAQQNGNVKTKVPFTSPWRLAISGTLGDIVESTMVENVSPPNKIKGDTSWIEPGVTAWTWMTSYFDGQRDYNNIKKTIDFAAEMGWKYYILDEGWQPNAQSGSGKKYNGYFKWFYDPENKDDPTSIVNYAKSKGIGLIAWVICGDLDTPEERKILDEWAEIGIKGIKADFFDRESQDRMQLFNVLYEKCADLGLVMNYHGSNKPTGEIRTWPNALNREAIYGEEQNNNQPLQTTILPFTRGVVGPSDWTPRIYPGGGSKTTTGQQIALNIIFESGMPCMASSIEDYKSSPALPLFKNLPAAWDDTHFIDGYPGKFMTMARRSGDTWFASSITNQARDAEIPLDFLDTGRNYHATIYRDGAGRRDLIVDYQEVTSESVLTIPMSFGGGCTVKITTEAPNLIRNITLDKTVATVVEEEALTLKATIDPVNPDISQIVWSSSNPEVATVDSNGVVVGLKAGKTTITASSKVDASIKAECTVTVLMWPYKLADGWRFIRENTANKKLLGENKLQMVTLPGDLGEHTTAQNVLLRDAPKGDFIATVKVNNSALAKNYQTIALTAYANDTRVISTMRRHHGGLGGNVFELFSYNGGYDEKKLSDNKKDGAAWLKLERVGDTFTGYYSYDNLNWVKIGTANPNNDVTGSQNLKLGLYATNGNGVNAPTPVVFEDFTVNGETIAFAATKTNYVTAIKNPRSITVDKGTAFDKIALPQTVSATLATGESKDFAVVWSDAGYDANTVGTYALTGTLTMEGGITNPDSLKASIDVEVKEKSQSTIVTAIENPSSITVNKGTAFDKIALPKTVSATLATGESKDFAVVWSGEGYNRDAVGTYTLTGTLTMMDGITNPDSLKASIDVEVKEKSQSTIVTAIENPSSITVNKGTAFDKIALPKTVSATLATGENKDFAVVWSGEGYNRDAVGTYTLTGTLTMMDGITNPDSLKASIEVIVKDGSKPSSPSKNPSGGSEIPNIAPVSDVKDKLQGASENANVSVNVERNYNFGTSVFGVLLKNKDKSITLEGGWYQWIFDGKNIINDMPGVVYFDTRINTSSPNAGAIKKLTGNANTSNLYFNYEGELPGKTTIRVRLNDYANKTIYVYYFNPVKNRLELVKSNAKADENGWIEFAITHCSDYVVSTTPIAGAVTGTESAASIENPETGGVDLAQPVLQNAKVQKSAEPEIVVPATPEEQTIKEVMEKSSEFPWATIVVLVSIIVGIAGVTTYKKRKAAKDESI